MGIYLPNTEMPTSCHVCVAAFGGCCYVAPFSSDGICPDRGRPEWCPLVEVPPHGRLIDADAFERLECNGCDGACEMVECDCINCDADCRCDFMLDIRDAPTIIPAEEA